MLNGKAKQTDPLYWDGRRVLGSRLVACAVEVAGPAAAAAAPAAAAVAAAPAVAVAAAPAAASAPVGLSLELWSVALPLERRQGDGRSGN